MLGTTASWSTMPGSAVTKLAAIHACMVYCPAMKKRAFVTPDTRRPTSIAATSVRGKDNEILFSAARSAWATISAGVENDMINL